MRPSRSPYAACAFSLTLCQLLLTLPACLFLVFFLPPHFSFLAIPLSVLLCGRLALQLREQQPIATRQKIVEAALGFDPDGQRYLLHPRYRSLCRYKVLSRRAATTSKALTGSAISTPTKPNR